MTDTTAANAHPAMNPEMKLDRLAWAVLCLVAFAQISIAGYRGDSHFAWLIWSGLAALGAALVSLRCLLNHSEWRSDLPYLTVAVAAALWIMASFTRSLVPEYALPGAWTWWYALLLVPVARHAWHAGFVVPLAAVLILPAASLALWRSGMALEHPAGYRSVGIDSNLLADRFIFLLLMAMVGYFLLRERSSSAGWRRATFAGLLLLAAIAALLVQQALNSRAGMGLLLGAGCVMALVHRDHRLWAIPGVILGVFILPWLLPEWATFSRTGSVPGAEQFGSQAWHDVGSGSMRASLRAAAWQLLPQAGVLGLGFGAFRALYPQLRGGVDTTHGALVHNDWLQLLLEAGPPFLLALLIWVGLCALAWWRCAGVIRQARQAGAMPPTDVLVGHAMLVGVGAMFAHAFLNFPLYDPTLLGIIVPGSVLGISAAWASRRGAAESDVTAADAAPRTLRFGAWTVLGMLGLFWRQGAAYALAQVTLVEERSPFVGVSPPQPTAETHFSWASRLARVNVGYGLPALVQAESIRLLLELDGGAGEHPQREQIEALADAQYRQAIERSPWMTDAYVDYAEFLRKTGRASLEQRLTILESGLERDRFAPRLWLAMAEHRQREGQWEVVAAEVAGRWLVTCTYAVRKNLRAALDFYRMIPAEVNARHPEEMAHCRAQFRRVGVVLANEHEDIRQGGDFGQGDDANLQLRILICPSRWLRCGARTVVGSSANLLFIHV